MTNINKRYKKLGINVALMTIGNFASKILSFVLLPLYTAVLTTTEYGITDIIMTTINLILPIFTIQINEGILRYLLEKKYDAKDIFKIGLSINGLGIIIFLLFSPLFCLFSSIKNYFVLFVILQISSVTYTFVSQFTKGCERIRAYSMGGIINTFSVLIFNIAFLVIFRLGINGYLLAYAFGYIVATIYLFISTRMWIYIDKNSPILSLKKNETAKNIINYSIPLIPNALCWWVNNSSDKYILKFFSTASVVGIYSISYKIPSILTTISGIFFSAWQISAVEDFGGETSTYFYNEVFKKIICLNSLCAMILMSISKLLAGFLFSNDFYIAWKYTILLIGAFWFNTISSFVGTIYTSAKKTKMLFITSVISAVVNIVLNILLIPRFEIVGAAVATMVSYFLVFIIRLINTRKILSLKMCYPITFISIFCVIIGIIVSFFEVKYSIFMIVLLCLSIILTYKVSNRKT